MNDAPQISVVMPVYNAGRYLPAAIESVLNQTFRDFELILVNDASTDNSQDLMRGYSDDRVRIITNETNQGITKSLNHALQNCRAPFIARMDADDIMHPDRLQKQYAAMLANHDIAVLATRIEMINEDGEITGIWNTDADTTSESDIRHVMSKTNCIAHPSVMMRKEIALEFQYTEKQKGAEDWDLWLRILNRGFRILKLDEVLLSYRIHPASIMASKKKEDVLEKRLMKIRSRFLWNECIHFQWSGFMFVVLYAQCRTLARHLLHNMLIPFARSVKRVFTYSPFALISQSRQFNKLLGEWKGNELFIFTYVHEGGAEQVHADILKATDLKNALVIITGFSRNQFFLDRFNQGAQVLFMPDLANHPFTKTRTLQQLANLLEQKHHASIFSSNNEWFFDLLPYLKPNIRLFYLIHAFHFQPGANLLHKKWLKFSPMIEKYIFISQKSMSEFSKFCFHHNVLRSIESKFIFISNAVHSFREPAVRDTLRVLFVGRESAEKRVEIFVAVAQRVLESDPQIHFSVVGMNERKALSNVTYYGQIKDVKEMQRIYGEHDLLVVTSNREGFPLVIMEAMSAGLAIAATPVGDIPQRLNNDFVKITTSLDPDVVAQEITAFILYLKNHPAELVEVKRKSNEFARQAFSWVKFQKAYTSLFNGD